jgi:hypothetical protein
MIVLFLILNLLVLDNPLQEYQWENRILVVFSEKDGKSILEDQQQLFAAHQAGMDDRDLIVFTITGSSGKGPGGNLQDSEIVYLKEKYEPAKPYSIILIGKDGGEKLRSDDVLSIKKLFNTIDAMPMRQSEMKKP